MNRDQINDIAERLLKRRSDVSELTREGWWIQYWDGPEMLSDDCLFDPLDEGEKRSILGFYFSNEGLNNPSSWEINVELAKLAAKDGWLVKEQADRFFPSIGEEVPINYFLHVAYWGTSPEASVQSRLMGLLDVFDSDAHDGIFIGCWFSRSPRSHRSLAEYFQKSLRNDTLETGTGEMAAYRAFQKRWRREGFITEE